MNSAQIGMKRAKMVPWCMEIHFVFSESITNQELPLPTRPVATWTCAWVVTTLLLCLGHGSKAHATPLIALREANNCGGCHLPGRGQRPVLDRRCTLDCQGCHIDPAGAGPRNQWGYYYAQDQLSSVNFFKPIDPLQDDSRFDIHYDGRVIEQQLDHDQQRTYPMSSELTLRVRPFVSYVNLIYQAMLFGRVGDQSFRAVRGDHRRMQEKFALMIDNLPMDTYVRAYRGEPMYGLRRPNHSLWIRERIGLGQFALTDAVEVGGTPNVPFMRASYMHGDPYALREDRQVGTSAHGGMRGVSYGWHVNGSAWQTQSEKAKIGMRALGAGLKPGPFVLMAERNWRSVTALNNPQAQASWHSPDLNVWPSSEISEYTAAFTGLTGFMAGAVFEELHDASRDSLRRSAFLDFHPSPFLQFEIWRRYESGTRHLFDTLAVAHLYADF